MPRKHSTLVMQTLTQKNLIDAYLLLKYSIQSHILICIPDDLFLERVKGGASELQGSPAYRRSQPLFLGLRGSQVSHSPPETGGSQVSLR